jgi:hypothetical protein
MAGRGPAPKEGRVRRNTPDRGDVVEAPAPQWANGPIPDPPPDLLKASIEAWNVWFASWFAAFWTPSDLPGLRQVIRLYDQVERGEFQRSSELRLQMDTYGITPKGQQDRRWKPPADPARGAAAPATATAAARKKTKTGHYSHLKSA